jgi:hypothetical protein
MAKRWILALVVVLGGVVYVDYCHEVSDLATSMEEDVQQLENTLEKMVSDSKQVGLDLEGTSCGELTSAVETTIQLTRTTQTTHFLIRPWHMGKLQRHMGGFSVEVLALGCRAEIIKLQLQRASS